MIKKFEPIKKLIALTGDEEAKAAIAKELSGHVKKSFASTDLVMGALKESLRHRFEEEFSAPIVVKDSHVRHFFAKLKLGVRPLQDYVGKVLNTRAEAISFFLDYVSTRAFGAYWMDDQISTFLKDQKEGIFLVTDLSLEVAQRLKKTLGENLVIVCLSDDANLKTDLTITPKSRRITKTIVEKFIQPKTRRQPNDRAIES